MQPNHRIITNTFAQYIRTFVNVLVSLYTVRLVLSTLGTLDYGLYVLVAGVVAMLSFLINSLTSTTQRFVCFHQGKSNLETLKDVYCNSIFMHTLVGLTIVLILVFISPFLLDHFLNVPQERILAVKYVYVMVVLSLFLSFVTAPFKALLISHENIVYISAIEILDCFLKLALVMLLTFVPFDKLIFYSIIMLGRQFFYFCMLSFYCFFKYEECIFPSIYRIKKGYFKELASFAGWNIYGTGCILGRQQGIAIVLNKFFDASMNAAYGIGFQIAGYVNFLSSSLSNAISPQIIKAEGAGERKRSIDLSYTACKMMFFLLATLCIPSVFEIRNILNWWLKDVPTNAPLFCVMVLLSQLFDSITLGMAYVNQAVGKIRLYNLLSNTPKLLTLVIAFLICNYEMSLRLVVFAYMSIELLCAIVRLFVVRCSVDFSLIEFFSKVLKKVLFPIVLLSASCFVITHLFEFPFRFLLTFSLCVPVYFVAIYFWGFTFDERVKTKELIKKIAGRK